MERAPVLMAEGYGYREIRKDIAPSSWKYSANRGAKASDKMRFTRGAWLNSRYFAVFVESARQEKTMDMFDFTDPGFLAYMESEGCMDTKEELIARVAKELDKSPNEVIDTEEFRSACEAAGVDPDSFT